MSVSQEQISQPDDVLYVVKETQTAKTEATAEKWINFQRSIKCDSLEESVCFHLEGRRDFEDAGSSFQPTCDVTSQNTVLARIASWIIST